MTRALVAPEREGDLIGLALADLDPGESFESSGTLDTVAVVLGGVVEVEADGESLDPAGGRSSASRARATPSMRRLVRAAADGQRTGPSPSSPRRRAPRERRRRRASSDRATTHRRGRRRPASSG